MNWMNSNKWLSSNTPHLHPSTSHHQFSLALVNENVENPYQVQEWNLIGNHPGEECPKVADFLGMNKSFNEIRGQEEAVDYSFHGTSFIPIQNSMDGGDGYQENVNTMQTLTLSMGSAKGSSSSTQHDAGLAVDTTPRRTLETFGQRTSIYRGVTKHRWTGRYEAHLWDNSCRREGQSRKGRQVYLGGYDKEEKAARSYDLAALKYWGTSTTTNFPISNYEKEIEEMKNMTRQEFVASIRRKSSGFSRGASMYRGVTRHHQHGRWQARIGRVAGNKDLYLGTFSMEEEAAEAYDIAAIKFRGLSAVTNFDMNRYDVKSILESSTLPIGGGAAKRLKEAHAMESSRKTEENMAAAAAAAAAAAQFPPPSTRLLQSFNIVQQQNQSIASPFLPFQSYNNQDPQFHLNFIAQLQQLQQQQQHENSNYQSGNVGSGYSQLHNIYMQTSLGYAGGVGCGSVMGGQQVQQECGGGYGEYYDEEMSIVKVDYDGVEEEEEGRRRRETASGYGGWASDESSSVHGSGGGYFTMW